MSSHLSYRLLSRTPSGVASSPEYTTTPDRLAALVSTFAGARWFRLGNCVGALESGARGVIFGYQGASPDDTAAFEALLDTLAPRLGLPVAV